MNKIIQEEIKRFSSCHELHEEAVLQFAEFVIKSYKLKDKKEPKAKKTLKLKRPKKANNQKSKARAYLAYLN